MRRLQRISCDLQLLGSNLTHVLIKVTLYLQGDILHQTAAPQCHLQAQILPFRQDSPLDLLGSYSAFWWLLCFSVLYQAGGGHLLLLFF